MTEDRRAMTPAEVAAELGLGEARVRAMAREGGLVWLRDLRGKPVKPRRILRWSVERVLGEDYYAVNEPDRTPPAQEAAPGRRDRDPSAGSLAGAAVGSGGALHRRIGPQAGDVAVRRVPR